jgi:radical SAM protein with 4Fe4S-binding SPASM domain
VARIAISLDGPDAVTHDGFRQVPGSFDRSIAALESAREMGLETQVQAHGYAQQQGVVGQNRRARVRNRRQDVERLLPVATGPAAAADDLTAEEYEEVFETLYELSRFAPFDIKTTEGMHYRRYIAQKQREPVNRKENARRVAWRSAGVGEGKGFVFVSHRGEIFPGRFLPVTGGNVLRDSLVEVHRNHPMFLNRRSPEKREGKCGCCEYQHLCGGSRARAYAQAGDYLAEDPRCVYEPRHKLHQVHGLEACARQHRPSGRPGTCPTVSLCSE